MPEHAQSSYHRSPVGGRRQRKDHRLPRREGRPHRSLPGREQRRAHDHRGRQDVQAPRTPVRGREAQQAGRHRERRGRQPRGARGGDQAGAGQRRQRRRPEDIRQGPPHHELPQEAGRRRGEVPRQERRRHHQEGHRTRLPGQDRQDRVQGRGPPGGRPPGRQDLVHTPLQEGHAGPHGGGTMLLHRRVPAREDGGMEGHGRQVHLRHVRPHQRRPGPGQERHIRGRPGRHAGHRPRDVPLRHLVRHLRRRHLHRIRCCPQQDRRRARCHQGLHHPRRRGALRH